MDGGGIQFSIRYDDAAVRSAITGLIDLGRDPAPVMRDLAMYGEASTRERFETQTAPDGTPWKKSLRARLTGGKTLTQSGHLGNSITSDSGRDWAAWGTNMIYGRIHQLGGEIKPKAGGSLRFKLATGAWVKARKVTMPDRPYLGVNEADEVELTRIVHAQFLRALHAG
jgi:phage virion morphogenesis protein